MRMIDDGGPAFPRGDTYEGTDYDTMIAVGPLHLTENEARAILKENQYHREAQKRFLEEVTLTTAH